MVKKTVKPAKSSNIQRTREEQWRRRLAAQGGTVASGATMDRDDSAVASDGAEVSETTYAPRATAGVGRVVNGTGATRMSAAATRNRTVAPASAAAQRRMAQPARAGRLKLAANTMSIEEEMKYVRSDIRTLIILTVVCLAVLIALSFVIR